MAWDLNNIYNFKDTEKLVSQLKNKVNNFKQIKKELSESISSKRLIEILKQKEEIVEVCQKLGGYAELWLTENTTDSKRNSHVTKINETITMLGNELIFFELWFKSLSNEKANQYMGDAGKYSYYFRSIRRFKDFTLNEKQEQIINLKDLTGGDAVSNFYNVITNQFTFDWQGKKITQSELVQHVKSPKKEFRKKAYQKLLNKYLENESILGEIYKTLVLDWKNENMLIRGFKSPISVRNLGNDIPDKSIQTLLNVINKNIGIFHEYFKIKAKILGEKKLSRFDVYAPITKFEKTYTYQKSKEIVLSTYKDFSQKSYDYAKEVFELNHIHHKIQKGKQSGAFCATISKDIAPYVQLNFAGKLNDVFTMMHELGHAIHGRAAREQTQFTFHSALPMAELASIFGETLLEKKIIKQATKQEKKSLLIQSLDNKYASIIRQAYFVMFEQKAHKKIANGATIQQINALYIENLKKQFGDSIEIPNLFQHEWKYIPHIYHTPFYCYAYAFGNLLGLSLYSMYEQQPKKFVERYMKVLSAGGSDSPQNILNSLNINISNPQFWQSGFDLINKELQELKKLI